MKPLRPAAMLLCLSSVLACSSDSPSNGSATAASNVCFAQSMEGNLAKGCFCYANGDPAIDKEKRPKVASCRPVDVSPTAFCCSDGKGSCQCLQVGCQVSTFTGCDCGNIWTPEVASCKSGTRCCKNTDNESCGCDDLGTECPAAYNQVNVAQCVAATLTPSCLSGNQISSCTN